MTQAGAARGEQVVLGEQPSAEELVVAVEGAASCQAVAGVRSVTAAAEEEVAEEAAVAVEAVAEQAEEEATQWARPRTFRTSRRRAGRTGSGSCPRRPSPSR